MVAAATNLILVAFVIGIGFCLHLIRRGKRHEAELYALLDQAIAENYGNIQQLNAIKAARANGVTYTADQVGDWLINLTSFASIGKILALKITGLWEVKAKLDENKAEKCIHCHKAITYEGAATFVPTTGTRMCLRCVVLAVAQRLSEGKDTDINCKALSAVLRDALDAKPMDKLEDVRTREDLSIGATPAHKEVRP